MACPCLFPFCLCPPGLCREGAGAATVASFSAAVLTEIYLCGVCVFQEILRRHGRAQRHDKGNKALKAELKKARTAFKREAEAKRRSKERQVPTPICGWSVGRPVLTESWRSCTGSCHQP
jgi:hypothetical protein